MSDVRLTATNPVDSSVVPVSCNAAGELLVAKPVISEIDNDLTVDGVVVSDGNDGKSSLKNGAVLIEPDTQNYGGVIEVVPLNGTGRTVEIKADGSATFAGNVSAPNINTFVRVLRERISTSESLEEMRNSILHALEAL